MTMTMPIDEVARMFEGQLDERITLQEEMILGGNFPGGYDRYQRECGVLKGLKDAKDLLEQVRYVEDERERGG